MIVVADTSPIIALVKIGEIGILPRLYGTVVIPTEVAKELAGPKRPAEVKAFIASPPLWLSVRNPTKLETIGDLHAGELAAISLAIELRADLLLIDETKGREAAIAGHVRTARTAAVLFDAANAGAIMDLRAAYDKLKATNFRVPPKALDELLRRHQQIRAARP